MSDCSTNANGPYDVARLRIEFEGEEIPWMYPLALNGRTIKGVFVDNERYERVRECEVVGEWKFVSQTQEMRFPGCSECGFCFGREERIGGYVRERCEIPNHCPNCGARVRGGGDD